MPLLSELREFKASFANVGGQKANLAAKKIPINDLKLPETEAEPAAPAEPMSEAEPASPAEPVTETAASDTTASDTAGGIDDLNFSDLLNAMPGDLSVPDIDDQSASAGIAGGADQVGDSGEQLPENAGGADESYFPHDELLSDLSNELEPVPPTDSLESDSGSNLDNLDNLEKFNFPEPPAASAPADAPVQEEAQADVDGALDLSVFDDLGDFGDLAASSSPDLPEPQTSPRGEVSPLEEPTAAESEPLDLGGLDALGGIDLPEEPAASAADVSAGESETSDLSGIDLPEEPAAAAADVSAGEGEPLDLGGLDALGGIDLPEEPEAAAADVSAGEGETPDFSGFDLPEEPAAASEGETPDFSGFDLPEEPAAAAADVSAGEGETPELGDLDTLGDFDLPGEPAAASEGETPDLGDLGLPEEPAADVSADESETPELGDLDTLGDFDLPGEPAAASEGEMPDLGDLGLPEEPAAAAADVSAGESETPELGDLDALGDFDLPGEPAAAAAADVSAGEGETSELGDLDDFDLPEAPAAASEDETFSDLGDFDLPEAPAEAAAVVSAGEGETPDFDMPKSPADADDSGPEIGELDGLETPGAPGAFDDFNLPEEPAADVSTGEGETLDALGDFDLPDEPKEEGEPEKEHGVELGNLDEQLSVDGLVETASDDAFEGFDPGGGIGQDTGDGAADNADSLDDIDDFSFPDLDVGESPKDKKPAAAGKAPRKKDKRKGEIPVPEKEDDIELNDNELRYLQETLAGYPLNLRIACEEIIAEQSVRPEQMVRLIRNLIRGAPARETAALASEILERPITVPRGFEKSSVEALEAQKATFAYIFIHNFLPVLRLITLVAIVAGSVFYLTYKFVYIPLKAESIYKMGYERIPEGEYERANERFNEAFNIHRKKDWFYKYADAFTKERQYIYAEQKYEDLLRYYPRDKLGVLAYANLETKYLRNYEKADSLLRHQILDYNPNDPDALLALGDNSLAWGEIDPSKYEDARFSYARLIDLLGQQPFLMERMMKYFIRTDNLKEVLPIWQWFDYDPVKRPLGAETLSELGGYLLDKQLEEVRGVPNEYVALIDGVRDILLRAERQDTSLPEPHYHLARYYKNLGNDHEERITLEIALNRFEKAEEGSLRRLTYRIDAYQRYADNLINSREFIHAEEQLQKGINLYDDAISRRLLSSSLQYGRLYAGLGDLEYFVKTGDMEAALRYYNLAQQNGWAPPDMRYRMGAAHYQLENWQSALENFFAASQNLPQNRRILFALGNSALKRGDYFVAQGYYSRLLDILENHRARLPLLLPNDRPDYLDLAERLMMARNNAGVTNQMLAARTGNRVYQSRAMSLYSEAERAWDSLTREPRSMIRSASTSLPFLNIRNILYPRQNYEPQMYMRIDREASEFSRWEQLVPPFRD
jgi:hypothetical protein